MTLARRGGVALLALSVASCSAVRARRSDHAERPRPDDATATTSASEGPREGHGSGAAMDAGVAYACAESAERACLAGGVSQLGRAAPESRFEERPPRGARLRGFGIDRREVTAEAYARCVADGRCRAAHCDDGRDPPATGPASCVAWQDARGYCETQDGRLPTEAEWERAAAGLLPEHRAYPWGDDASVAPDGASVAEDVTPEGVLALGGGVAEWVEDCGAFYTLPARRDAGPDATSDGAPGADGAAVPAAGSASASASASAADQAEHELADSGGPEQTEAGMPIVEDPRGPADGAWRVLRGGNEGAPVRDWTSTRRRFRQPGDRRSWIGFRCAYDGSFATGSRSDGATPPAVHAGP